ncbi:phage portal protein [Clostridium tyrobutyricum]|uniref:phage portal protein n=1 Tax=Clostridium tyrobutyricum TaxID=1519 RepID=UPI001C392CB8|nr:phage portal protein [Clostridium tyrobutyricum]MBV4450214.1 phage portal protein [Clostridium tyrobutyricum]
MDINEYIDKLYNNNPEWFIDEVNQGSNLQRVSRVIRNKEYLHGVHKIKEKKNMQFKGKTYITKKLIINEAKTILNFHSTYLLGKPLSLVGSENKVKEYQNIYRKGNYNDIDFDIIDSIGKYGDAYEYVYLDKDKNICSKLIDSEYAYPVITETNEYVAFIENWTINGIDYYNVYYPDKVDSYNNENENINLISSSPNVSGLPIHYHNKNDIDPNFGVSLLYDMIPILDELEDLLSKLGDGIYTLSLSPIPTVIGQQLEGSIDKDAVGYAVSLEMGSDMKYVNANMDYSTIKMYLDIINQKLNMVAHMPSIVGGNTNISNVSEVSLKLLYQLADVYSMVQEKCIRKGLRERFKIFDKLLALKGITFNDDDYVSVEFNYSRPVNAQELLDELNVQYGMGAISKKTIIEKSPITTDVSQEMDRLASESNNSGNDTDNHDKVNVNNVDKSIVN